MKKILLATAAVLMLASPVSAQQYDVGDLTDLQKAKIATEIAKMKNVAPSVTAGEVLEYAKIGEGIGKALASTARELGVEVNKFADTKVGFIALALIVWHFFGTMFAHLIAGGIVFFVGLAVWCWSFRRLVVKQRSRIEAVTAKDGKTVKTTHYAEPVNAGDRAVGHWIVLAVITLLAWIIGFNW